MQSTHLERLLVSVESDDTPAKEVKAKIHKKNRNRIETRLIAFTSLLTLDYLFLEKHTNS